MSIEKFKECHRLYEEGLRLQRELDSLNETVSSYIDNNEFTLRITTDKDSSKRNVLDSDGSLQTDDPNVFRWATHLWGGSVNKKDSGKTKIVTQDLNQAEFLEVMSTIIKRKRQRLKEIADHLMKYELDLNK